MEESTLQGNYIIKSDQLRYNIKNRIFYKKIDLIYRILKYIISFSLLRKLSNSHRKFELTNKLYICCCLSFNVLLWNQEIDMP